MGGSEGMGGYGVSYFMALYLRRSWHEAKRRREKAAVSGQAVKAEEEEEKADEMSSADITEVFVSS